MSDYLPDTPVISRDWCPTCEPERDPTQETLEVRHCHHHQPDRAGLDDQAVTSQSYMSGGAEAGGEENRVACDLLHRGVAPTRPTPKEADPCPDYTE